MFSNVKSSKFQNIEKCGLNQQKPIFWGYLSLQKLSHFLNIDENHFESDTVQTDVRNTEHIYIKRKRERKNVKR